MHHCVPLYVDAASWVSLIDLKNREIRLSAKYQQRYNYNALQHAGGSIDHMVSIARPWGC